MILYYHDSSKDCNKFYQTMDHSILRYSTGTTLYEMINKVRYVVLYQYRRLIMNCEEVKSKRWVDNCSQLE